MTSSHYTKERCGFTLIELLVVVAILGILAAILFPVFSRTRESARRTACASNMKQIGMGLLQYAQDYDEKLPRQQWAANKGYDVPDYSNATSAVAGDFTVKGNNWILNVYTYAKSWELFRCPSAVATTIAGYEPLADSNTSYMANGVVMGRSISIIPTPADTIFAQEDTLAQSHAYVLPFYQADGKYYYWLTAGRYSVVHFGGGNLLFCDGHVKWRKQSAITSTNFGLGGNLSGPQAGTVGQNSLF